MCLFKITVTCFLLIVSGSCILYDKLLSNHIILRDGEGAGWGLGVGGRGGGGGGRYLDIIQFVAFTSVNISTTIT